MSSAKDASEMQERSPMPLQPQLQPRWPVPGQSLPPSRVPVTLPLPSVGKLHEDRALALVCVWPSPATECSSGANQHSHCSATGRSRLGNRY